MVSPPLSTAGGGATPTARADPQARWRASAAALLLFIGLAVFHTWPLAAAPGTWSRNDNGDALLNEWTIAWVAHQLPHDPLHLFDANIFYPERRTLGFSEHLLPQALLVAPVLWEGGSPVLAFNLSLLAGMALTAWAMCLVIRRWTGNWWAGLIAGCLAGYNASSLTRLTHIQSQHLEFLPLALLALDRLFASARVRHALALGAWFALQALTSGYFLAFTSVAMVVSAAVRPAEWLGSRFRQVVPRLLLSVATALAILAPFLAVYWRVRQEHGLIRNLREVALFSAGIRDYLATGALLHWPWSKAFWRGDGFFPGFVALLLVALALAPGTAWKDRRARMWLAIGVVSFCFSFGVAFPPYVWLHKAVPLFQGVRAVSRYGQFVLLSVAALAGFGAAWWLVRVRPGVRRTALAVALLVLVNAEAWRGPLKLTRFEGVPRVFRTLASVPHAVVACFPFYYFGSEIGGNGRHMLNSTANWQPMLNGYSGFRPRSFLRHVEGLTRFPDGKSIAYLHDVGVTHVVIDTETFYGERLEAVGKVEALRLWMADGRYRLYELR
jgi:hypothetical protein